MQKQWHQGQGNNVQVVRDKQSNENEMGDNKDNSVEVQKKIDENKQEIINLEEGNSGNKTECKELTMSKQLIKNNEFCYNYSQTQMQLRKQLQSMQFEESLIEDAIMQTSTLQQAIQFIISKLQANDQKQILSTSVTNPKIYFIVRMDLKMGTGKIAAQVAHAALKSFQQMRYSSSFNNKNAGLLIEWMQNGGKTQILQAETEYQIRGYLEQASEKLINNCYIRDAGRTQIAAGSMTVGAIGPVRECDVSFLNKLKPL